MTAAPGELVETPPLHAVPPHRYRRPVKVYVLRFTDADMDGLVVRAKSVPLGRILELSSLMDAGGQIGAQEMEQVRDLFAGFAESLVSWNLDDDAGLPVPATLAGLLGQDLGFGIQIITAWMEAIVGTAGPLPNASSAGGTNLEASLPMAPPSTSLESWSTPS